MNRWLASLIVLLPLIFAGQGQCGSEDQNDVRQATDLEAQDSENVSALVKQLARKDSFSRKKAAESLGLSGDRSAVDPLIRALDDKVGSVSASAATALGRIGDPRAVDPLIQALTHGSDAVCGPAAKALGEIGGPRAIEGLIGAIADKWWFVRACVVEGLGKIGDERSIETLVDCLRDSHSFVRTEAVVALSHLNWSPQTEDEKMVFLIAQEAWDKLVGIGTPATLFILPMLEDDDMHIREAAAVALDRLHWQPQMDAEKVTYLMAKGDREELLRMGSRSTDGLIEGLKSEHDWVRRYAAGMLGEVGDSNGVPPLVHALGDKWDSVREVAAGALDNLNWQPGTDAEKVAYSLARQDWSAVVSIGKPAIPSLIDNLAAVDMFKAREAASALGRIGDKEAVQPLIEALGRQGCHCRAEAATALGEIRDDRAIRPLYDALQDDSDDVRFAASVALGKIGPSAWGLVMEAFHDGDPRVRESAIRALGTAGDAKAMPELVSALKDSHADVRRLAVWAMGAVGGKNAVDSLTEMLGDKDPDVRRGAALALQRVDRHSYERWMAKQRAWRYGIPSVIVLLIALALIVLYALWRKGQTARS